MSVSECARQQPMEYLGRRWTGRILGDPDWLDWGVPRGNDRPYGRIAGYTGIVRLACVVAMWGLLIPHVHAQQRKMIQVDDTFHGREVALQVGQTLKVSLSENASTGHQWSIPPELKSKLTPVLREREETVEAPDGPPGKPGVRHLYFEAVAAGTANLEIHYRRSWERNSSPARKFKLRVVVKPASGR
jgi:inhibitor of cysteine peptidase